MSIKESRGGYKETALFQPEEMLFNKEVSRFSFFLQR